jgi:hypothetical protein
MKRREFITFLGGATMWPIAAQSQLQGVPVIGFLSARSPAEAAADLVAFRQGLGPQALGLGERAKRPLISDG